MQPDYGELWLMHLFFDILEDILPQSIYSALIRVSQYPEYIYCLIYECLYTHSPASFDEGLILMPLSRSSKVYIVGTG